MSHRPPSHRVTRPAAPVGILALLVLLLGLPACETTNPPVANRGEQSAIPVDSRGPNRTGALGPKELESTTDEMLASIVASLGELDRNAYGETIVVLDRLANRTAYPEQDFEIFLASLRRELNQSGARYQIRFVEDPTRAEGIRNRVLEEPLKDDYDTPGVRPHYALYGDVYTMLDDHSVYWMVDFRLIDLNPDARIRNEIVWENASSYRFLRG